MKPLVFATTKPLIIHSFLRDGIQDRGCWPPFRLSEKRPGCGSIERLTRWIAMRTLLLVALIVVLGVDAADARRRHHHHRSDALEVPADERVEPGLNGDPRANTPRLRRQPPTIAALVPRDWQPVPQNPNWYGKRFLSPDGTSWLAIYRASAEDEPAADHMRSVIFAKDETITYLRGERTWFVVRVSKTAAFFTEKPFSLAPARPGTTSPSSIRPSLKPEWTPSFLQRPKPWTTRNRTASSPSPPIGHNFVRWPRRRASPRCDLCHPLSL